MPNAQAARIHDKIQHSQAQSYRNAGMVAGVILGAALVVAAAAAVEFFSGGLATPLVVAAVATTAAWVEGATAVAETAVVAGAVLGTGAAVSDSAADRGKKHMEDDGEILTGVPTIFIGGANLMAAYCGSKATCKRHNNSPPGTVETVAQGSASVFLGPGRNYAARVHDQVTCQAQIGSGCTTVIIGGATAACQAIDKHGDDPDQELFDKVGEYAGYAALAGGVVLAAIPAAAVGGVVGALRAGAWALTKGGAILGASYEALKHISNEQTRHDAASALAIFLPFAEPAVGAVRGAARGGGSGGSSSGGGDTGGSTGGGQMRQAGSGENTPPKTAPAENPVNQIDEHPGGSDGTAPPDQAGGQAGGGKPAETPGASGSGDPVVQQGESPGGLRAAEDGVRPDLSPEENFPGPQSGNNCAPQSCQQIIRQATGVSHSEAAMEGIAQRSGAYTPENGTYAGGEADILNEAGVPAHTQAQTPENIQQALDNGQGVITGHDAATLWEGDPNYTADPANPVDGGHAVHTTGLVRDADGNVTHYVINDTGTGTFGRMVPADQFHQSLDTGPAAITDAPIRTPAAAREAAPTVENAPASPEGTTVPRDAASRGDPTSEEGDPASGERVPENARPGEEAKPGDTPEAKASGENLSGDDANAVGDGDPTVQTGDRPGGLRSGEGEDGEGDPNADPLNRGARARRTIPDDTLDQWATDYADNINSNRVWSWKGNMDNQIPESARASIKQRAVDQGLIPDIPVDASVTNPGYADFRGHILTEVQMPEYITKPDGTTMNLWKATDDVQFRWLNDQVRLTDPDYTNQGDADATWHHHEGGGIDEGDNGSGRPDGTMQLVERGIHNATTHSGGRSDGLWADAPR